MKLPVEIEKAIEDSWHKHCEGWRGMKLGEWAYDVARLVAEDCAALADAIQWDTNESFVSESDSGWRSADAIRQRYGLDEPTDELVAATEQARRGEFVEGPDLEADGRLIAEMDEPCDVCEGKGWVYVFRDGVSTTERVPCPKCGGKEGVK